MAKGKPFMGAETPAEESMEAGAPPPAIGGRSSLPPQFRKKGRGKKKRKVPPRMPTGRF